MGSYKNIFENIATRTNGDIYLGVVGPVRVGKSTFISNFMKHLVVPNIENSYEKQRVIDELPQAADGTAVMTTQPKFVPSKAISIKSGANSMRVRLIDCVGFMVDGATGQTVDGKVRNVKTPWSENEMPFDKAAEIGTKKVIKDHSTIAVAVTTDGTITDIPRKNYAAAEEKVIMGLKQYGKPFVVVVNSRQPDSVDCKKVCKGIADKFSVPVLSMDFENLTNTDINRIFESILAEFPVTGFKVDIPKWMQVFEPTHGVIADALDRLRNYTKTVNKIADNNPATAFDGSEYFDTMETETIDIATGTITYNLVPKADLYYRVLSNECGAEIDDEQKLVAYLRLVSGTAREYGKLKKALDDADSTGYGVVVPTLDTFKLDTPRLHKNGRSYGLKLRATAPSLHI
ncbi:MAG: stage IV sporulation protein A, partial [Christensenellaceae bacterium]|nr:stage IV sporulation protein A [Christensenellaceae bacterium]